jgi:hypothetical protein
MIENSNFDLAGSYIHEKRHPACHSGVKSPRNYSHAFHRDSSLTLKNDTMEGEIYNGAT